MQSLQQSDNTISLASRYHWAKFSSWFDRGGGKNDAISLQKVKSQTLWYHCRMMMIQLTFRKCDKLKQSEQTKVCNDCNLVFYLMCIVYMGRRMGQVPVLTTYSVYLLQRGYLCVQLLFWNWPKACQFLKYIYWVQSYVKWWRLYHMTHLHFVNV